MIALPLLADDRLTRVRLFVSVWLVLVLHFATNIAREHYPAITLAEHATLAVGEYLDLHPDLFVAPTGRAVINNPPGASILAAVPLLIARPALAYAETMARRRLPPNPQEASATYEDPRPNRQRFFRLVRQRGLDLKFGVVSIVTTGGLMAPMTALFAVVFFRLLIGLGLGAREALLWAVVSVFGTPLFFRDAYLNHNHLLALFTWFAFVLLWRGPATPARVIGAGALAGWGVLLDYSGVVPLLFLGTWAVFETGAASSTGTRTATAVEDERERGRDAVRPRSAPGRWVRQGLLFAAGVAGPIAILLAYQWWAFGGPFTVPQAVMPHTQYSVVGRSGMTWPQGDLVLANLFDPRFGVFAFAPILLLALPGAWLMPRTWLSTRQIALIVAFMTGFVLFCSANQFARLQWNTGVRYLVPLVPFLWLFAIPVLRRLPKPLTVGILIAALGEAWALAMVRESAPESVWRVLTSGPELPWLTVLGKTATQYLPWLSARPSPWPLLVLAALGLAAIWMFPRRRGQTAGASAR
jgi:hypothetical protein